MIYMFDIDGTLTNPTQKINDEHEKVFFNWMQNKIVFLVTGSDKEKVDKQLTNRIIDKCAGIFTCMGNELQIGKNIIYRNDIELPKSLLEWLEKKIHDCKFSIKRENNFEFRSGMLNFSTLGRTASIEERNLYYEWDLKNQERKNIVNFINSNFSDFEARIGGQISIDIQRRGLNKSQAFNWVKKHYNDNIFFFGDRCEPGGNDYDIVKIIEKSSGDDFKNVKNPDELMLFL